MLAKRQVGENSLDMTGSSDVLRTPDSPAIPTEKFSHSRLLALTVGLAGLQFCWAVQIGYVTRTLLQMHLAEHFVSLAWLAGPMAGIVVQPIVGILSDRCTLPIGRRRPFLIGGTLITLIALFCFAYAARIGAALGVSPLVIAISSFWALDFAMNAVQGPIRTLMADVVPPDQQQLGNSYFAFMTGIGSFSGNMLGSLPLASLLPIFDEDGQALYVVAMFALGATMSITVICTRERPLMSSSATGRTLYDSVRSSEDNFDGATDSGTPLTSLDVESRSSADWQSRFADHGLVRMLREAPRDLRDIFIMQCFTWFAWFTIFIFATSWVGSEVYNGDADAPIGSPQRLLYDAGVRAGNFGLALQAVVASAFALVLPKLVRAFSASTVLFWSHMCLGVALAVTLGLHHISDGATAQTLLAFTGLSWATTMTVPWALASEAIMRETPASAGQYLTIFNLSQCLPEVLVSLVTTVVVSITKRESSMLGLGGAFAFAGGAYVLVFRVGA